MKAVDLPIPNMSRRNAEARFSELREWTNAKLDAIRQQHGWLGTELMDLPNPFTRWGERMADPEGYAVKYHDIALMRELRPRMAPFIDRQRVKGKGKSARSRKRTLFYDLKNPKVRVIAAAIEVDEIKTLWKQLPAPRPGVELAIQMAAERRDVSVDDVRKYRSGKSERA